MKHGNQGYGERRKDSVLVRACANTKVLSFSKSESLIEKKMIIIIFWGIYFKAYLPISIIQTTDYSRERKTSPEDFEFTRFDCLKKVLFPHQTH